MEDSITKTVLIEIIQPSKETVNLTTPITLTPLQLSKIINQNNVSFFVNSQKITKNLSFHVKSFEKKVTINVLKDEEMIVPASFFNKSYDGHSGAVLGISYNISKKLYSVGGDNCLVEWDTKMRCKKTIHKEHSHWVQCVDSITDGEKTVVATGSMDSAVNVFVSGKSCNLKKSISIKIHKKPLTSVNFASSSLLLTTSRDMTVSLLDLDLEGQKYTIKSSYTHNSQVLGGYLCKNNKFFFSFCKGKRILIYEIDKVNKKLIFRQEIKIGVDITTLFITDDNSSLFVGCDDGTLYFYNISKGKTIFENNEKEFSPFFFKKKIEISKDSISAIKQFNNIFLAISSFNGRVFSLNIESLFKKEIYKHASPVLCLESVSKSGNIIMTGCMSGYVRVFEFGADKVVSEFHTEGAVYCLKSYQGIENGNKKVEVVAGGADGKLYFFS